MVRPSRHEMRPTNDLEGQRRQSDVASVGEAGQGLYYERTPGGTAPHEGGAERWAARVDIRGAAHVVT